MQIKMLNEKNEVESVEIGSERYEKLFNHLKSLEIYEVVENLTFMITMLPEKERKKVLEVLNEQHRKSN